MAWCTRVVLARLIGAALVAAAAMALPVALAGSADAADARMVFTSSTNSLGVLTSIDLSPTSVSIPADGKVRFVNRSGVTLVLAVGGQSVSLPDEHARAAMFPGDSVERSVAVSATAFDLPVVGSLSSASGTVTVAAASSDDPPDPAPAAGDVQSPAKGPGLIGPVGGSASPAPAPSPRQSQAEQAPDPTDEDQAADPAVVGIEPSDQAVIDERQAPLDGTLAGGRSAVRDSTVTTVGDGRGIGLIILVATVLLGGVGTAAVRSLISVRAARVLR